MSRQQNMYTKIHCSLRVVACALIIPPSVRHQSDPSVICMVEGQAKHNALIREVQPSTASAANAGAPSPTQNENAAMPTPCRANGGGFIRHGAARSTYYSSISAVIIDIPCIYNNLQDRVRKVIHADCKHDLRHTGRHHSVHTIPVALNGRHIIFKRRHVGIHV